MDLLEAHGYDLHFREMFEALADASLEPARVIEEQRGMYRVVTAGPQRRVEIAGRLRQGGVIAAIGDWVALQPVGETGGVIQHVLERQSKISRKFSGRTAREQVLVVCLKNDFTLPDLL